VARDPQTRRRLRAGALIGVLTGLLGFAIAVQVHANSRPDNLANLRDEDLIGILDNQNAHADRLRQQIDDLQRSLRGLRDSGNQAAAARRQAAQEAADLGVLLGTLPAHGPGVVVTVSDPSGSLTPEELLDVVEELRGAGAEAIAFGSVRISSNSAFTPAAGGAAAPGRVAVDGTTITAPYRVVAIGDPKTLDTALNIPGGVASVLRTGGGDLRVSERTRVAITVTRKAPTFRYARPSGP
jgi:uncharacterized protein YlxW (UPF0749 family)